MDEKEIKKIYFNYNCNLEGIFIDYGELSTKIRKIAYKKRIEWSKEFLEEKEKELKAAKTVNQFSQLSISYETACKNYQQLYVITEIYYDKIIKEKFNYFAMYIWYYEVLLFEIPFIEDKKDFKEKSLLEYLYKNNKKTFYQTIKKLKLIIDDDKRESELNIKYIEKLQKYLSL